MAETNHVEPAVLQQFVDGRLDEATSEQVMAHLGRCEACLETVDALWARQSVATAVSPATAPDPETARRVERRVIKRIHLNHLSNELVRLSTRGFADVMVAMARPFMARTSRPQLPKSPGEIA